MEDRTSASGRRPQMPFAIGQANWMNLSVIVTLWVVLFWLMCGGYRPGGPVLLGISLICGLLAPLFAIGPYNPFRSYVDRHRRGGRAPKVTDLSLLERRILTSCYEPHNRRKAALGILIFGAALVAFWGLSLLVMSKTVGGRLKPAELAVVLVGLGLAPTGWVGMFGLTSSIRRNWAEITSAGRVWPSSVEYPGPLREAVHSVITGRFPDFFREAAGPNNR
jgi:hypothetical protein